MMQSAFLTNYLRAARAPEAMIARLRDSNATEVTDEVATQAIRAIAARDALIDVLRTTATLITQPTDLANAAHAAQLVTLAMGLTQADTQSVVLTLAASFRDAIASAVQSPSPGGGLREATGWVFRPRQQQPTSNAGGQTVLVGQAVPGGAAVQQGGQLPTASPAPVGTGVPRRTGNAVVDSVLGTLLT
jgi:hypothetical protein